MKKEICLFLVTVLLARHFQAYCSRCSLSDSNLLDPNTIPKWTNQLAQAPPIYVANNITDNSGKLIRQEYTVSVSQFQQQLLPTVDSNGNPTGFGATTVWGFEGEAKDAVTGENLGLVQSTPGGTFEAIRGVPVQVKWVNDLVDASGNPLPNLFAVDPTINWANPNGIQTPNPMLRRHPSGYHASSKPSSHLNTSPRRRRSVDFRWKPRRMVDPKRFAWTRLQHRSSHRQQFSSFRLPQ